jgi:hypothetical protein
VGQHQEEHIMLKTSILGGAALALLFALPANAADVKSEVVTAATHAGLAASATNIEGVHTHLHHTVNCLAGSGGAGFDAKQMNPCANTGNGAIADTTDAAKKKALENAQAKAMSGIKETNMAAAQKDATDTAAMLKADE